MAMIGKSLGAAAFLALVGCNSAEGQQNDSAPLLPGNGMAAFTSDAEVDALLKKAGSRAPPNKFGLQEASNGGEAAADAAAAPPMAKIAPEPNTGRSEDQVTNVQEKGVDEGGIVKRHGDHLVVLRRGRLFTIDTKGDRLTKLDQVDAFPPGNGDAWYDEMLISGDTVIVVGYSYGRFGTEVNRFGIDDAGQLTYRDTWHLRSADYYSSRNYASRLIGTQLVLYQPIPAGLGDDWQDSLPGLRRWRGDGPQVQENAGFKRLAKTGRIFAAAPLRSAKEPQADTFHSVVTCDLARRELDCDATVVLGGWSRSFYVSKQAVYVWTGDVDQATAEHAREAPSRSFVYRIPLDGGKPGALAVKGDPLDQFSFLEETDKGRLNVMVLADSGGDAMWNPELGRGRVALAQFPLSGFGDGAQAAPESAYRSLSGTGYGMQNRFVGRYLLYGGGWSDRDGESQTLGIVPLDGGEAQGMSLRHSISRFDVMGQDAVAIGSNDGEALGFSAIGLGPDSKVLDTYFLPAAAEGENRSQAFFYKPDPADRSGASGILGLPVARQLEAEWARFLGSGSAIVFLNRVNRRFTPAGELAANARGAEDDACKASCVDWYGNARPLFLGNRTFALMGYELVEGRVANGRITEKRRLNFAPDAGNKRH